MSCIHVFRFYKHDKEKKKFIFKCVKCGKNLSLDVEEMNS